VAALILGSLLALATSKWSLLRALFSPLISLIKSTPVASFIILVLIWVGRDILPSVIVLLMALPVVWANVSEGIARTDPLLLEMAQVFRFSRYKTLRRIYIPSLMPYFLSACRSCLGLAWKAGVAAEVLCTPRDSIGKLLFESKIYYDTTGIFAHTLVIIVLSIVIEKLVIAWFRPLEKRFGT